MYGRKIKNIKIIRKIMARIKDINRETKAYILERVQKD